MPKYKAKINDRQTEVDIDSGDYRIAVVVAAAQLDEAPPCRVTIWCEDLMPDYGPYRYLIQNEPRFGHLVVTSG